MGNFLNTKHEAAWLGRLIEPTIKNIIDFIAGW